MPGSDPRSEVDDELVGLDRDDPEVQAFAAHLDRVRRSGRASFTVESYLEGVGDFADSANRASGPRRAGAVVIVLLLLLGVLVALWDAIGVVLQTLG